MSDLLSPMRLDDWRGDLNTFRGPFSTVPSGEHTGLGWSHLGEQLATGKGPFVTPDKSIAPYALPCGLKDAPLVGKTLERAIRDGQPVIGKQRSGAHVTAATWLLFDLDGVAPDRCRDYLGRIVAAGVSFLFYTSWSFGRPDKPGIRARVSVPVDEAMGAQEYAAAHGGGNAAFFDGAADKTGSRLCQQQGLWATSPDRKHLAMRRSFTGGVASARALIARNPGSTRTVGQSSTATGAMRPALSTRPPLLTQVLAALRLFDSDEYHDWDRGVSLGVALAGYGGQFAQDVQQAVEDFSNSACARAQARNAQPQYDVATRFAKWKPTMSPDVAAATMFGEARDRARQIVERAIASGSWKGTKPAWEYVAKYHLKTWDEVYGAEGAAA